MAIKIKVIFCIGYFLMLYIIAFFSNLHYREDDDVLWIGRNQWKALLVMWIPSLVLFV